MCFVGESSILEWFEGKTIPFIASIVASTVSWQTGICRGKLIATANNLKVCLQL